MSGLIYPNFLAGKMLTQRRSPTWNTKSQRGPSGKESRISLRAYPLYEWELQYEFLNDNTSRTNYIPWSQDFTQWTGGSSGSGWTPVVVGTWVGSQAPDGTYSADRLILDAFANSGGNVSQVSAPLGLTLPLATTYTFSVWLKTNDGTTRTVALIPSPESATSATVSVTGSWQRFSVTFTTTVSSAAQASIACAPSYGTGFFADLSCWGAQFEAGSLATYPYIATFGAGVVTSDLQTITGFFNRMMGQFDTFLYQDPDFNTVTQQQFATGNGTTTTFNLTATYEPGNSYGTPDGLAGLPEWIQNTLGLPVIYTNRYGQPEMLSSAGRTNLALQSNFAGSWAALSGGGTIATAAGAAPDGTTTAAKCTLGTAAGVWGVYLQQTGMTGGLRYTFSVWLKYNTQQYVILGIDAAGASTDEAYCVFDLVNGLAGTLGAGSSASASQVDVRMQAFANGWYRCSIAAQLPSADTTLRLSLAATSVFTSAFLPTMTPASQSFFMWGAQLEAGTQPTALIPTTTAHITVAADYSLTNSSSSGDVQTFSQVSFATAPANTVALTWSGTLLYRVRFSDDKTEFKEDYGRRIWTLDKLALEQVFL